jgi:hypothetical protein
VFLIPELVNPVSCCDRVIGFVDTARLTTRQAEILDE